jgi:hypothetical protein
VGADGARRLDDHLATEFALAEVTHIHRHVRGSAQIGWFARARFSVLALAIAGMAGPAIALTPLGPFVGSTCAGSGPYYAALVVEHGNGVTVERCIAFSSATITGAQLLEMSEIEYATASFGGFGDAVCQIDTEPEQFSACLPPSPDPYWAMFVSRGHGPWTVSNLGISSQTFADGDAEGFRYDSQTGTAAPPPVPTPCPAAATPRPTATAKQPAAATPRPTATSKPPAAATPRPTATPKPSSAPTPRQATDATPKPTPATSPTFGSGPTSTLLSPSPVASVTAPPTEPTDASSTGALATAAALLALLVLLVVTIAAARSRSRRAGR